MLFKATNATRRLAQFGPYWYDSLIQEAKKMAAQKWVLFAFVFVLHICRE
jgi:hypothetical protein